MSPPSVEFEKLGQITQGITPSRYVDEQGSPYRIVSVTDLENLYLENAGVQVPLDVPNIKRYQLQENDVVIAIRGALLKSSVVKEPLQNSVSNQNTVFFRAESEIIDPLYLAALLRSSYFQQTPFLKKRPSTTTLPAIRVSDLRSLKIPVPELPIQIQIAQLFLSIEQVKKVTLSAMETRQRLANAALIKALGM